MSASSSELFRRGVVLPATSEALFAMRADAIEDPNSYQVVAFADDEQFYRIWKTGVFLQINLTCDVLIDDYEQTEVRNSLGMLPRILADATQDRSLLDEDRRLLERIKSLAIAAECNGTSLFFIF